MHPYRLFEAGSAGGSVLPLRSTEITLAPAAVRTVPSVVDYVVDMGHSVLGRVVRQDVNVFHIRENFETHISH